MTTPFDIFDFLHISRREDVLHAPMLGGLLDPFGPHGLGDTFLQRFVALVAPEASENWSASDWVVKQQQRVPGGRVDLLLLCRSTKTAIAIEVKIDAVESKSQLRSYREWLRSLAPYFTSHRLIFLTLSGIASRVLPDDCTPFGFRSVLTILEDCVSARSSSEFEPAIRTYIDLLARILGLTPRHNSTQQERVRSLSNLFRFLRISRRESVLHTRMLAGLLDSNASHNESSKFLVPFLGLFRPQLAIDLEGSIWKVDPEHKIPGGRLDILLTCEERGALIAIENKIDAREGTQQLERYANWMDSQKANYPSEVLAFLTIEGSAPVTAGSRNVLPISYRQILQILETGAATLGPTSFKDILDQYLHVIRSILPESTASAVRFGRKLSPSASDSAVAGEFLADLARRWDQLPVKDASRPLLLRSLVPRFMLDSKYNGKYSSVEVWHDSMLEWADRPMVILRVEILLSNKRVMGVWVGLHWKNLGDLDRCARYLQLPEATELMELLKKFYSVQDAQRKGFWVGIAERLEYPRSDGALISLLRHHRVDVQRAIVSSICGMWNLCGDKLLAFNRRLGVVSQPPKHNR